MRYPITTFAISAACTIAYTSFYVLISLKMSSRPLGWSRTGADKMARLRIYRQNKRDILELVRYQKKELPLAAGAEEVIYSATQMLAAERRNKNRLGKLAARRS